MPRPLPLLLVVALTGSLPRARAGEPVPADLARRLRSADAAERARGVADLALVETAALRPVLDAAAGPDAELERWARTLLGLAREARGPRQRELVRALLASRARLRVPAKPPAPEPPFVAPPGDPGWVLHLRLVQARGVPLAALVGPSSASKAARMLAEADLAKALAQGEASRDASLLGGPALALVGPAEASSSFTRQRAYVERYDVTVGDGAHPVVSPVVDTFEEGVRCTAVAVPAPGESAHFRLRVELLEVAEPLDAFEAPLAVPGRAEDLTVRVQVPDLHVTTRERALPLVRDLWTVVAALEPPLSKGAGSVVVLARADRQPPR